MICTMCLLASRACGTIEKILADLLMRFFTASYRSSKVPSWLQSSKTWNTIGERRVSTGAWPSANMLVRRNAQGGTGLQIGRTAGRERVEEDGKMSGVGVDVKKKRN